jgi:hypothetical protein
MTGWVRRKVPPYGRKPTFASRSAFFGLSKLSVWWLRPGIGIAQNYSVHQ